MTGNEKRYKAIITKLKSIYPEHPYIYFGKRGSTLLYKALSNERRNNIILPGFICADFSAMVQLTGKRLVHIDVNPSTLHMEMDLFSDYIENFSSSDACLLIDHSFGYINPFVEKIRNQYPKLLILEDCVRASGGKFHDLPIGSFGDWVLLSMYKTLPGNAHGAILLSRNPLSCTDDKEHISSLNEYLSTIKIFRFIYSQIKRRSVPFRSSPIYHDTIHFVPMPGMPSPLIISRFFNELKNEPQLVKERSNAWDRLHRHLEKYQEITLIKDQEETTSAKHFLSFFLSGLSNRNDLLRNFLQKLYREGFFLLKTWTTTPNYYRCFQGTFPYGDKNTKYLARNIVHIPIADFLNHKHQDRFLKRLKIYLNDLQSHEDQKTS
jgi:dTDP-4-amino-4,6-dideoxygalactose transaminase